MIACLQKPQLTHVAAQNDESFINQLTVLRSSEQDKPASKGSCATKRAWLNIDADKPVYSDGEDLDTSDISESKAESNLESGDSESERKMV